ncbi:MAG: hypothetical protein KGL53_10605 [Elusimicrobia bacterium]|nr:hypothetical protein [Elusimicrobiota bacterium]
MGTVAKALPLLVLTSPAWCCAVCFGASDDKSVIRAFCLGGVVLLVCAFGSLAAIVTTVVRAEKVREARDRAAGLLDEEPS